MRIRPSAPSAAFAAHRVLPAPLLLALASLVLLSACEAPAPGDAPAAAAPEAAAATDFVRTADPTRRGLTEADFPRVQELAPGVYSYEALRSAGEERFTTVSLFVVTTQGVLVADGQGNVAETQRMVDAIAEITPQPITYVVVGSDHGDHTGGNAAFPPSALFLAHPTSIEAMQGGGGAPVANATGRGDEDAAPRPTPTFEAVPDRRVVQLGDKEIHVLFLGRAHTGGDLSVYLPEEKILFMSEAYLNRVFPAMRSAYPSEWVATIEAAQALDVDTYVPGHGFVESPAVLEEELERYRQAMIQVIAEARRLHEAGVTLEAAQEQAAFGELEEWTLRQSQGPIAIRRVYEELNGELPR